MADVCKALALEKQLPTSSPMDAKLREAMRRLNNGEAVDPAE